MARRKEGPRAWVRQSHRTKTLPASKRRWEVVYETGTYNGNGEPVRRTRGGFPSKSAAERYRDTETPFAKSNADAPWIDPAKGDVTFQATAEHWLTTYVSESGKVRGYAQHAAIINGKRSLVRKQWGARRIGDITHGEIKEWLARMAATRSQSTMRHNFYTFRLVIRHALGTHLILTDPTAAISLPKQKTIAHQQAKRYALSTEQVQALIAATPERWQMYTRLAAATGMRPEELTGLQLRDLSDDGVIRIERVWVKDELNKRYIYEDAGKTDAARRTIRVDDFTLGHLRDYLTTHQQQARAFFDAHPDREPTDPSLLPLFPGVGVVSRASRIERGAEPWGFTDANGEPSPMRHAWFGRRYWETIRADANVPTTATFYDLRHFYGSWHAARLGQPGALTIAELADSMGHRSTKMTLDRYVHVEPDVDKRNAGAGMWATDDTNVVPLRAGA